MSRVYFVKAPGRIREVTKYASLCKTCGKLHIRSLVMSLMASFCAVLFPRGVLDEIWDLHVIGSVSDFFKIVRTFESE